MSDPRDISETEEPIATRTRTRLSQQPTDTDGTWCTRQCTLGDRQLPSPPSSDSSLSVSSCTETEFPSLPSGLEMENEEPELPPALRELLETHCRRLNEHDRHILATPPRTGGIQPPIFRGSPSENVEWLTWFEDYAAFNRWTNEERLRGFSMFVQGNAKRFCQRQPDEVRADLQRLQQVLRDGFTSPYQNFLQRQELNTRTQGPLEPLEKYIDDAGAHEQRLQLSDAETMQCFMQGLKPDLKEHVILQLPASYSEATDVASLKDSLKSIQSSSSSDNLRSLLLQLTCCGAATRDSRSTEQNSIRQQGQPIATKQDFLDLQDQIRAL